MGIVVINTAISLDGFVAGPNDEMDWIFDKGFLPAESSEEVEEVIRTTGAILSGRRTYEVGQRSQRTETAEAFGGRWSGPEFVLTHRPPSGEVERSVTFLGGDIRAAVSTALEAAQGRNLLVLGANVARQCLEAGLADEMLLMVIPIVLGAGIRLFEAGGPEMTFETVSVTQWGQVASLRFRKRA